MRKQPWTYAVLFFCTVLLGCESANLDITIAGESPEISSVSEKVDVSLYGTDSFTVTGQNFSSLISVKVGDRSCNPQTLLSPTAIRCKVPLLPSFGRFDVKLFFLGKPLGTVSSFVRTYAIVGQPSAVTKKTIYGLANPFDVKTCGDKLAILDTVNSRVLFYNNLTSMLFKEPAFAVGQPDLATKGCNSMGSTSRSRLCTPYGFTCSATKLVVSDSGNRRVLIWNSLPTANGAAPDVVLGQPDFESSTVNNGGLTASSVREPVGAAIDGSGRLYIVDSLQNSRVLIWNSIPTSNFAPANLVVGQSGFTSSVTNTPDQGVLHNPLGILIVGNKLLVSDVGRVLIWNTLPLSSGALADVVVGQSLFNTSIQATSQTGMRRPTSMASDGTNLMIADNQSHRIMVFNAIPTANGASADFVLGQANFTDMTANSGGLSLSSLSDVHGVHIADVDGVKRLFVADKNNNRVLVWNAVPTSASAASQVIGQPDGTSAVNSWMGTDPGLSLNVARSGFFDGTRFAIADTGNHRVLIWNSLPSSPADEPDVILGQPTLADGTPNSGGVSARTLNGPRTVRIVAGRIFVADSSNHRVLIWNSIPTANFQPADVVLGQPGPTTNTANNGGLNASSLSSPYSLEVHGNRLYVTDGGNNRVLIWNSLPTSAVAADLVLGQAGFTTGGANAGGISGARMNVPVAIAVSDTRIAVADTSNHRVLIWNSAAPPSSSAADVILGQANGTSNTANSGAGAQKLNFPAGAAFTANSLYVTDRSNHRILRFNLSGLTTHASAVGLIGQSNFDLTTPNAGESATARTFYYPEQILKFDGGLVVADRENSRVLLLSDE